MELAPEIEMKRNKLAELCKKYKVSRLFVFGSMANGNFNSGQSDVDLIAEIDEENPVAKGETIMSLWTELENLFSRKVDLVTGEVRNPYLKKQIEATKQIIYDAAV
ncbi:nucleotidyltransferase domain-containing protein [Flavobacterium sp. MFBS3-15]|uniref:nucleotidyltransferase family protein n=1 Tax=Flavobacterium sp. MFBS3-15 TaxID=2989816 RepID=UPI002236B738|nr:nucleotidyltransferase domain-containing protein [Flavobacterium sp. MFBS3-15]MCW4470138.1 nucleotidyltransferase domain-containing protein [Flavobacterium sp. MFBS3-15]